MVRVILFSNTGVIQTVPVDQIEILLKDKSGFFWVDLSNEPFDRSTRILHDLFHFDSLAIDDALHEIHVPKVDDWETYLYLVLRSVQQTSMSPFEVLTPELDIFFSPDYLVTFHNQQIKAVDRVWDICQHDQRFLNRGAGFLLYQLADEIATETIELVDNIGELMDQIEDGIIREPDPSILEQIFSIKRVLQKLRRSILPQREVLNKLARGDFRLIENKDQIYFRDVYDHMVRLHEINEGMRDLIGAAFDTYLSVLNKRMNEIMKVLTIISTIFIPLSFFTGIYGMNFVYMPLTQWRWGYFTLLFFLGIIFIGMVFYFKNKKWF